MFGSKYWEGKTDKPEEFREYDIVMPTGVSVYPHDITFSTFMHEKMMLGEKGKDGFTDINGYKTACFTLTNKSKIPQDVFCEKLKLAIECSDACIHSGEECLDGFVDWGKYIGGKGKYSWTLGGTNPEYIDYKISESITRMIDRLLRIYYPEDYEEEDKDEEDE